MPDEKRIDPADGVAYSLDEIRIFYKGTYKKSAISAYWNEEMKPVKQVRAKSAVKAKAKAKTKVKAKKQESVKITQDALEAGARQIASVLLSEDRIKELVAIDELLDDVLAMCVAHGIVMYKEPALKFQASAVPVTLLPAPFVGDLYRDVRRMTPDFHKLMDSIALDVEWLKEVLDKTGKMDAICGGLIRICEDVYGPGKKDYAQDIRLHITRNDFMLDTRVGQQGFAARQIELNMIAASFSTHCEDLTEVQRHVLTKYLPRLEPELTPAVLTAVLQKALPRCSSASGIARALAGAHSAYSRRWKSIGKPRVVLFVSADAEKNELDHRKLEVQLFKSHGVLAIRRSFQTLSTQLDSLLQDLEPGKSAKALIVDGHEVTVVYFRAGYWPDHFDPEDACWAVRKSMEVAEAVKCPSAPAQLAGMKKVQQMLCTPSVLQRFASSTEVSERLQRTFARQSDPSEASEEAVEIVKAAEAEPSAWVMKPQVEGSGELIFGDEITKTLQSKRKEELAEFILMERIFPAVTSSPICRIEGDQRPEVLVRRSVAELGIFGVFLADGKKVLRNEAVGHLLRSKGSDTNQGGVFVGNAVVDVPFLVPTEMFWPAVSS